MKKFINKKAYLFFFKILVIVFYFGILNSCQKKANKTELKINEKETVEEIEVKPIITKAIIDSIDIFFKNVDGIEVFAYLDRNKWDRNDYEDFRSFTNFKNGQVDIKQKYIRNHIKLNKTQIIKVREGLKEGYYEMSAACYDPRHLIVFYDINNQIIGHIEICFECMNFDASESCKNFARCAINLGNLFQEYGITYFEDTKEEFDQYIRM